MKILIYVVGMLLFFGCDSEPEAPPEPSASDCSMRGSECADGFTCEDGLCRLCTPGTLCDNGMICLGDSIPICQACGFGECPEGYTCNLARNVCLRVDNEP